MVAEWISSQLQPRVQRTIFRNWNFVPNCRHNSHWKHRVRTWVLIWENGCDTSANQSDAWSHWGLLNDFHGNSPQIRNRSGQNLGTGAKSTIFLPEKNQSRACKTLTCCFQFSQSRKSWRSNWCTRRGSKTRSWIFFIRKIDLFLISSKISRWAFKCWC